MYLAYFSSYILHIKGQKSEKIIPRKNDLVKVLIQIVNWLAKSMLQMIFMRIKGVKLFLKFADTEWSNFLAKI